MFLAISPGNQYEQYGTLLYPSVVFILIGTFRRAELIFTNHKKALQWVTVLITSVVVCLNAIRIYPYCRYFWSEVPQEMEEREYIKDNSQEGDTIAVVSPYYSGLYIATNRESATKYVYVQLNHFENMKNNPEDESRFWTEYSDCLMRERPRIIVYDRDYNNIAGINDVMEYCLKDYTYAGCSARLDFYLLKRTEDESISEFVSDTEILSTGLQIDIPPEMIESYRRGDISIDELMDEIMKLYDEEVAEKFGK